MTLAELIATMPDEATSTDAEVLTWLETLIDDWQDVPWLELQMWLHAQGITRADLETAATSGTAANKTAAQHVLDTLTAGLPLYATDSRVRDVIAASSLGSAAKDALVVLATVQSPRYRTNGLPKPRMGDVMEARA